jgi:hypothetical protein
MKLSRKYLKNLYVNQKLACKISKSAMLDLEGFVVGDYVFNVPKLQRHLE